MKALRRALLAGTRTRPWLVEATAGLAAAVLLSVAAALAAAGLTVVAVVALTFGLLAGAAGVAARAFVIDARQTSLRIEVVTLRLALASVARDAETTARSVRHLGDDTSRAVSAALALSSARDATQPDPDGAVLVAIAVLGAGRQLHFVGDEETFTRYSTALGSLSPDTRLGLAAPGLEGGYLDRQAERRRSRRPTLPVFVADDPTVVTRLVSGDLGELVEAILGVPQFVLVAPPRVIADTVRSDDPTEVFGDAVLLVSCAPRDPDGGAAAAAT